MTVEELEAMTADQPMTAEQAAIVMLQCMSPLLAHSGRSLRCNAMSAFGGKADIEAKLLTKHEARRSRVGYARSLGKSLDRWIGRSYCGSSLETEYRSAR